ncbi:hypothetical protein BGZ65_004225 [Modicella reniformis]|uniref:Secreted protein n=1 Tax=Modicella reniformis TaxID=1440133 RepID=A0A9P6INN2_9FUNG|nr:hypothetical protein BGZ65_004225 [Modicella reniformis]
MYMFKAMLIYIVSIIEGTVQTQVNANAMAERQYGQLVRELFMSTPPQRKLSSYHRKLITQTELMADSSTRTSICTSASASTTGVFSIVNLSNHVSSGEGFKINTKAPQFQYATPR